MAERIADNPERIVDEMKRKARRRLVGAIVLALAAAIVVPMLLEKEPRPLGDDVSVQIPPVDEGRFVNRLTGKAEDRKPLPKADAKSAAAVSASKSEPKAEIPAPAAGPVDAAVAPAPTAVTASEPITPRKSVTEAEQRVVSPSAKSAPKAEAKTPSAPKNEAKPAPKAETVVAPEPRSEVKSAPAGDAAAASAKAEGFVVQLAAFADDKGANALANKLKKSGYATFVQPVETSRGTLWRVRVGGYGSRPEAEAARVALKGEGYSGIVAPAQ